MTFDLAPDWALPEDPPEAEAQRLTTAPKRVDGRVRVRPKGKNYRIEVPLAVVTTGERLTLEVSKGSRAEALLVTRRNRVLRHWHRHPSRHQNPDGFTIDRSQPHKHFPTTRHNFSGRTHRGQPTYAYPTSDINPDGDPGEIALAFAVECNVDLSGLTLQGQMQQRREETRDS